MDKERLMFFDPETGIYTFKQYESNRVHYIHRPDDQISNGIFRKNKRNREADRNSPRSKVPTFQKAAEIPLTLWLLWDSMGITRDPVELKKAIERHPEVKTSKKRLI